MSASLSSAYFIFLKIEDLNPSLLSISLGVLLGIGTALLGVLFPALQASRQNPIDAILRRPASADRKGRSQIALKIGSVAALIASLFVGLHLATGARYAGYCALALLLTGVALSSPWLVGLLAAAFSGVAELIGIEGQLAFSNLARNPARTGFTAAAIIIGLAMVVNTSAATTSVRNAMDAWVEKIFAGDLIIAAHNLFTAGSVSAPLNETFEQDLLKIDGVSTTSAIRYAKITYRGYLISVLAVDGSLPGARTEKDGPDQVYVSRNFAELFHIRTGDRIPLQTDPGPVDFAVAGTIDEYNYNWPRGTVIVDRSLYKKYWDDHLIDQIILHVVPGEGVDAVRKRVISRYGARYNLTVFTNREFRDNFMAIIDQQFSLTYAQLLITVVVVTLAITNALMTSVVSRRMEIGVFRAVGASQLQSQKIVVLESALLGLAGIVYGTALGSLVTAVFVRLILPDETGWIVSFRIPLGTMAYTALAALVISVVGAILPLREIQRQSIVSLVRYEE